MSVKNTTHSKPIPNYVERPSDTNTKQAALAAGFSERLADLISRRTSDPDSVGSIRPRGSALPRPEELADIDRAAIRVARAVVGLEHIAIVSDYDCDGTGAAAVLRHSLVHHFGARPEQVSLVIGRRLEDGYGISDPVADRVLALEPRPAVVISADCGSSDEARIARLAAAGMDVCVTDHHAIPPRGIPASAYAVINPQRADSDYPDPAICGGTVAWLLCCEVRRVLIDWECLPAQAPRLTDMFGFLALSTVADCVSISTASPTNRLLVQAGLAEIEAGTWACWRAVKRRLLQEGATVTEELIAFGFGPAVNARSRVVSDAYLGVRLLLSESDAEADALLEHLCEANEERKQIQRGLMAAAQAQAEACVAEGCHSLMLYQPQGHVGVQGIVASRLVERFGRPAGVFAPTPADSSLASGSLRTAQDLPLKAILDAIAESDPDLMVKYGGHRAACGVTLPVAKHARFAEAFDAEVARRIDRERLHPLIHHDGPLDEAEFSLQTVFELQSLAPYGREFESPSFLGQFTVRNVRLMGGDGTHLRLALALPGGATVPGVWFGAVEEGVCPVSVGEVIKAVFVLSANTFRGQTNLQCQIRDAQVVTAALQRAV